MSFWWAEVDVEDKDGDADAEGVEDHGEEDEFPEERHHQGGGRDDFGQQQEEHGEREQNVYWEGHLQPWNTKSFHFKKI